VTDRRMFAGRTEVLTALIRAIEEARLHAIVYGERGIGKTSLLHVLTEAAREARYLVSYVSCGAGSSFDETFRFVAGDISLLFHAAYGPTSSEAERGATFADLLPKEPISVRMASDLLAKVVGTRVIVVLDEFDRVESSEFRLNMAEFLKNLSDRSARVQLVIAGVAANLTELVEHIPSVQRSIFALEVPRMTEAEVRELVRRGEESSGLEFAEIATHLIVSVSNGLPYLASLISHHAGLTAIDRSETRVTRHDALAAIAEAVAEFKGRISKRSQKHIAACMREGVHKVLGVVSGVAQLRGGTVDAGDIASVSAGLTGHRIDSLLERLAAEGVLVELQSDEFGSRYHFLEDSVPAYLWLLAAQERSLEGESPMPPVAATDRGASLAR
jgi:Cdc6-like AAA superfamily ATPase